PLALTAALNKAVAFNDSMGKSGSVGAGASAVIVALETKNLTMHDDVDDFTRIMTRYEETDADFLNGYNRAKVINDIGLNHSGIEGTVTGPDGNPLKDVTVVCVQNDKKKDATDVIGHYEIRNFIPDNYEFKFSHPVHGVKIVIVKIERGKVKTVDVQMGV
ncbi:MAG TPA: carboxypeptidase-like regulatory domain-containing protein, partial [Bacteroidia bacterium]|nr:carboxypeptidase-like regulatory domain-containing protein [Bacteroidia bacterium]